MLDGSDSATEPIPWIPMVLGHRLHNHKIGLAPSEGVRQNSFSTFHLASGGLLAIFGVPGLLEAFTPISPFIFTWHSPYVHISLFIRTPVILD